MRDGNECLSTLAQRQAVQVHRTLLGHDPVRVASRGADAGPSLERRDDARQVPSASYVSIT
jgi:hypothetical protein